MGSVVRRVVLDEEICAERVVVNWRSKVSSQRLKVVERIVHFRAESSPFHRRQIGRPCRLDTQAVTLEDSEA
ncbi:hypothetical protein LZK73_32685 (plasmid) [Neorhizobium galegae]|nr:hypothetical protein LZK73_32685 [Neorhizobium galegae]